MENDTNQDHLTQLSERFEDLKARREEMEREQAHRLFRQRGGTDDEFMKDRPSQTWEMAVADACMDDARAIEATIDLAFDELNERLADGIPLSEERLANAEKDIDELGRELDDAAPVVDDHDEDDLDDEDDGDGDGEKGDRGE